MEIGETLYVTGRGEWRRWLETNFETAPEIWLVYPNKASGEPRILYNDAVEEALCFGWIDSIIKKPDELRAAQRFSPRRRGSRYSQLNKERLRWLAAEGLLHPSVRASVDEVLVARLDRVAADTNRKRSYLINRAPKEYFEAVEDHESLNEESSFPGSTNLSNRLASY